MSTPVRKWTLKLMELVDENMLGRHFVVNMCLAYMSEADVEDMCRANDLDLFPEEDENGED